MKRKIPGKQMWGRFILDVAHTTPKLDLHHNYVSII